MGPRSSNKVAQLQKKIIRVGVPKQIPLLHTPGADNGEGPPVRRVDRAGGAAVAVGSRAHLEAVAISRRTWYRNFLMHGFHFVVLLVAGGAVKDTQCGFKVPPFHSCKSLDLVLDLLHLTSKARTQRDAWLALWGSINVPSFKQPQFVATEPWTFALSPSGGYLSSTSACCCGANWRDLLSWQCF